MDYLEKFSQLLLSGQLPIRQNYVDPLSQKLAEEVDVVTDLIEHHQMYAVACLPIAKQILLDRTITIQLSKNGDLFVGLQHHPVIDHVTMILNNYTEEFEIEGQLQTISGSQGSGDLQMWRISELPIPLFLIDDYERININFRISLNHQYSLQSTNQEVFSVFYGYLHHDLKSLASNQHVLKLPLLGPRDSAEGSFCLKMVCGIWTLSE
jgi:hypothetical protein